VALSHSIRKAVPAGTSDRSTEQEQEDGRLLLLLPLLFVEQRLVGLYMSGRQTAAGCASAHLITTRLTQLQHRHVLISYRASLHA